MLGAAIVAGTISAMIAAGSMLELDQASRRIATSEHTSQTTRKTAPVRKETPRSSTQKYAYEENDPNFDRPGYLVDQSRDSARSSGKDELQDSRSTEPSVPTRNPPVAEDTLQTPKEGDNPPWVKYATRAPASGKAPVIAIVIDDAGLDRPRTEQAVELPAPITISYLPYARDLPDQVSAARAKGHEILLHMPMEPMSKSVDPGPHALKTSLDKVGILSEMNWMLNRFQGYVGINNHMGSKFTADADDMAVVMQVLKSRGLLFLDSRTSAKTVAYKMARKYNVPALERDVFIDDANDTKDIEKMLERVERVARKKGYVIAIGHPRDLTLEALHKWIPKMKAAGLVFVPATDILNRNGANATG
jgi:polysaccharide deacetylase 2 family uncharacterized protein YibQ